MSPCCRRTDTLGVQIAQGRTQTTEKTGTRPEDTTSLPMRSRKS